MEILSTAEIGGYLLFYMKTGEPIRGEENEITELPITLERKIIKPELKESCLKFLNEIGNRVPTEKEINNWLEKNK
jgi:hypothetical protein